MSHFAPIRPRRQPTRAGKVARWFAGAAVLAVLLLGALAVAATSPTPPAPSASVPAGPIEFAPLESAPIGSAPVTLQPARTITAREWQKIAKNPDGHTGQRIVVYGCITQFDASTSTTSFRADVDGVEHKPKYNYADYPTNTWLSGEPALLDDLVHGDLFRAEVTVGGTLSYDAAMGGQRTVPALVVTKIETIGSVG